MSNLRRHRLFTVLFALCSLLFMQFAVAGYACPVTGLERSVAAMEQARMPCAGSMAAGNLDENQPSLCHAHCQASEQASDSQPPQLPATGTAILLFHTVALLAPPEPGMVPLPSLMARQTAPPLAIRNCCWRI